MSSAAWAAKVQSTFQSIQSALDAEHPDRKPWIQLINKIGESRILETDK